MSSWRAVTGSEAAKLEQQLAREATPGHPLHGRVFRAVARRLDRDDVAFEIMPGGLCVVHLTWAQPTDARWPRFEFVV
ncbi:MAG: hypothetical protein HYV09_26925 [Deltaproteobacteria bacterium]|nr:hypothetical protein [Deltaproteobacteria bacterium]